MVGTGRWRTSPTIAGLIAATIGLVVFEAWPCMPVSAPGEANDLAIYTAVVAASSRKPGAICTLVDETMDRRWFWPLLPLERTQREEALVQARSSLFRRNAHPATIRPFAPHVAIQLTTPSEIEEAFGQARWQQIMRRLFRRPPARWWKDFYKAYPRSSGISRLTLPGYSNDHTQALIYFERRLDGLAAEGCLLCLSRTQRRWRVRWRERMTL